MVGEITCRVVSSEGPTPGPAAGTTVAEDRECGGSGPAPDCWRKAHTEGKAWVAIASQVKRTRKVIGQNQH